MAAANTNPGPAGPPGCEVRPAGTPTAPKGFGLFCVAARPAGVQIFEDNPLFVVQHIGNRRVVSACARCCAFVGSIQGQLEVMFGESRFGALQTSLVNGGVVPRWQQTAPPEQRNIVKCSQGCGECYCSEACRDAHFQHSHNLLCTGPIDREDHPLIQFKYHALEHADTLLLVAQMIAHLINRARAAGGGAAVTQSLMAELMGFVHAPFRDACRAPPGRAKDAEFYAHTDGLILKAATLLRAALEPAAPVEVAALFENGPAFLSELLGLCEYNNIDVEVPSPIGSLLIARAQALMAVGPAEVHLAKAELELMEQMLREKEWLMRCVCTEEVTGIYGEDVVDAGDAAGQTIDAAVATAAMGEEGEDPMADARMAQSAMSEARAEVGRLTFEQLIQAPWPALHGTGLFVSVARCNHSCEPNVKIVFPGGSARLSAVALAPVAPGDELCISYILQKPDVKVRRRQLLEYGFLCSCPRCLREDSGEVRRAQRRLK